MKRPLLSLLLLLFTSLAIASPDFPDGKWWKRPRVAEAIGLSPNQSQEIETIFVRSRGRLIDLKADLEKKQAELQDTIEDQSADREEVAERIEKLEDARAELQKARALMLLDMKRVLRPEQWDRLKRMQEEARRIREERRRRFREQEERERRGMREGPGEQHQDRNRSRPPQRAPENRRP